jgi:flagellar FliL protein
MSDKKKTFASSIIGILLVTAIAASAGAATALFLPSFKFGIEKAQKPSKPEELPIGPSLQGLVPMPIPTIITNLAGPGRVWVRLEFSVLLPKDFKQSDALAAQISQDTISYLRTVPLSQLEGPYGLTFLREDLEERVQIRIGEQAQGILFSSFIVE